MEIELTTVSFTNVVPQLPPIYHSTLPKTYEQGIPATIALKVFD